MKRSKRVRCVILVPMVIAFLVACVPLTNASESGSLNQWVAEHVSQDEKLLCKGTAD